MGLLRRVGELSARLRPPRQTVRLRLAVLYGALFLLSGAALLAITYALVDHNEVFLVRGTITGTHHPGTDVLYRSKPGHLPASLAKLPEVAQLQGIARKASEQHSSDLHELLIGSVIALGVMVVVSGFLGWVVAGRALRPLRTMTATAQKISAHNLHQRLAIEGPEDELKDLADTFDALLGRLEAAFTAQRRFVANASHELRTPLTLQRTLLEVALSDPRASAASLRSACERAISAGEKHEDLIESLLTLATSERGLDEHQPVDLSVVSAQALAVRHSYVESKGIRLKADLSQARALGSPRLVERLVANLVDNAVRHNVEGGRVDVATSMKSGHAVLSVSNTGPAVPPEEIERLFQPFQQLDDAADGFGLGLSIVKAITVAHQATVGCRTRPEGGLVIEVVFPAVAASPRRDRLSPTRAVLGNAEDTTEEGITTPARVV